MSFASPDARLSIDWDAEGAFAILTREGAPAEMIRLPDVDRLVAEAMTAALAMRGRLLASTNGYNSASPRASGYDGPPHFIGAMGE